jgi:hypothetical protein
MATNASYSDGKCAYRVLARGCSTERPLPADVPTAQPGELYGRSAAHAGRSDVRSQPLPDCARTTRRRWHARLRYPAAAIPAAVQCAVQPLPHRPEQTQGCTPPCSAHGSFACSCRRSNRGAQVCKRLLANAPRAPPPAFTRDITRHIGTHVECVVSVTLQRRRCATASWCNTGCCNTA